MKKSATPLGSSSSSEFLMRYWMPLTGFLGEGGGRGGRGGAERKEVTYQSVAYRGSGIILCKS